MINLFKAIFFALFFASFAVFSQDTSKYWRTAVADKSEFNGSYDQLENYEVLEIDFEGLKSKLLVTGKFELSIPVSSSASELFILENSNTVSKELQHKYPDLLSFRGVSTLDPLKTIRLDFNATGFHAMISKGNDRLFVDPVDNNDSRVIIYHAHDLRSEKESFLKSEPEHEDHDHHYDDEISDEPDAILPLARATDGTLRTYRLAVLCTAQYSTAVGGGDPTVAKSLASISTTINRVNEIYTRDLGVKLEIVTESENLIFLPGDENLPPNTSALLDVLYSLVNDEIGSDNYDLSHGFSTDAGGIAYYASVCSKNMFSGGVTGSSDPSGDAFDVDFVSHELGHQFSGDHTFNGTLGFCQGNETGETRWEPGSGSTIMAYAGICDSDNLQNNSDPYFHGANLNEMHFFIQEGGGSNCGTAISTGNSSPIVSVPSDGKTIPAMTPFELIGSATDADGDPLTYCWEQIDGGGVQGNPSFQSTSNAIFRSFYPSESPIRTFPQIDNLINGTSTIGDNLPDRTRELNFKLTVRDNQLGQGETADKDIWLNVEKTSGPFTVTSQGVTDISYTEGDSISVTWNVAETNQDPINVLKVDVLLSIDGGYTFETVLASGVDNNGSTKVVIPSGVFLATSQGRIKVKASDSFFFNINEEDFVIEENPLLDFVEKVDHGSGNTLFYPNPTTGILKIAMGQKWEVFNTLGERLVRGTGNSIDLSEYANGLYIIRSDSFTVKVIKE